MREVAPAKLNLFLHVLGKLETGYHSLESLVVFLELSDAVTLLPDQPFSFSMTGPMAMRLEAEGGEESHNLVVKAAHKLAALTNKPLDFKLHLEKHIPVQAGLGGGSADAAACLRLLCRHWDLDWNDAAILDLALSLGADVPVCLHSKPNLMRGIGENLEPAKVPKLNLLLTNSLKAVSTQTIFQHLNLKAGESRRQPLDTDQISGDFQDLMFLSTNDLQTTAQAIEPAITQSISLLTECDKVQHVRMTGSGATCFALFLDKEQAKIAEIQSQKQSPNAWFLVRHNQLKQRHIK